MEVDMSKRLIMGKRPTVLLNCARLLILALTVGLFLGCATGPRTHFTPSYTVSNQFEKGQLKPNHLYYVGGPQAKPNAIVAIDSSYTLESESWRQVDLTSDALKHLVDRVRFVVQAEYQSALRPNGARIVTADGEVFGTWYSVYNYSQVRLLEGKRIAISEPLSNLPSNLPKPI